MIRSVIASTRVRFCSGVIFAQNSDRFLASATISPADKVFTLRTSNLSLKRRQGICNLFSSIFQRAEKAAELLALQVTVLW